MNIVLVHGYNVTSTRTYGVLPQRLKAAGHSIKDVYISKYITLDDDITLADIVRAFDVALRDVFGASYGDPFACITHSTGGLVARAWVDSYYGDAMASLPMKHLIMLAPPNNGSRLAELGKSRLSRLRSLIGVEPGLKVLDALEIGSFLQWDLNSRWMRKKLHAAPGFYPVVMAGQWIDKKLWDSIVPATYERGSDGVVRASSANLNMQKISIKPDGTALREVMGGVPFLVPPKTAHSDETYGIMGSIPASGTDPVLTGILAVLDVDSRDEYDALESDFAMKTAALQRSETYYDGSKLDRYAQLAFRVTDSMGTPLNDYAVELIDGTGTGRQMPGGFLADKHQNEVNPEQFVFYLNCDKLQGVKGGKFGFRIQAAPDSPLIQYKDVVFTASLGADALIRPNQTTFVDVVLQRRINKTVFRITDDFSYQKITGVPSDQWIE
jgi:hypothetical protein